MGGSKGRRALFEAELANGAARSAAGLTGLQHDPLEDLDLLFTPLSLCIAQNPLRDLVGPTFQPRTRQSLDGNLAFLNGLDEPQEHACGRLLR